MHNQQRQCTAPTESLSQTGESSFWLWEGHPKQFLNPVAEAEDAAAWAVKSGKPQATIWHEICKQLHARPVE